MVAPIIRRPRSGAYSDGSRYARYRRGEWRQNQDSTGYNCGGGCGRRGAAIHNMQGAQMASAPATSSIAR